jgi:Biotin-lipoyl like
MNSELLTHDMTKSESRMPDWTLRTTGERPLPGKEITVRRRQSGVRRFLRLRRPTPFGRWTAVICLLTALCAGTVVILSGRSAGLSLATGSETTDDAYVRADQIAISSHITGYVESVPVRDNETVSQGQVVATVLNDDYRARLSAAEADLQVAQSSVDILTAQAALQKERIAGAEASCQSASDRDPRSASNRDPLVLGFGRLALAPSELLGVAETGRARVGV